MNKPFRLPGSLLIIVFPAILLLGSCGGGSNGQSSVTATIPSNINAIQLISVSANGAAPNGDSDSASFAGIFMEPGSIQGGIYVAFASKASNLVAGDTNGVSDVFLRKTCIGADPSLQCTPSTIRVSVATDGTQANGPSGDPAIAGRFVAFASSATNLAPGPNSGQEDIFLRDTCIGASPCTPTTIRVSEPIAGNSTGRGISLTPRIVGSTSSGIQVLFVSSADNLVPGDTNGKFDLFLRNICLTLPACTSQTMRLSLGLGGQEANGDVLPLSRRPGTTNGIVFSSVASNLVSGDTNGKADVFLLVSPPPTGAAQGIVRLSTTKSGGQALGSSDLPSMLDRTIIEGVVGFYSFTVLFRSDAPNLLAPGSVASSDLLLGGASGDVFSPQSIRSVGASPLALNANGDISNPLLLDENAPALEVLFDSSASNLVSGDTNGRRDIFLKHSDQTLLVSTSVDGKLGNGDSSDPFSFDGCLVTFTSSASNLISSNTGGVKNIFLVRMNLCPAGTPTF